MLAFHSTASMRHDPKLFFRRGALIAHPEQAQRYVVLRDAMERSLHALADAEDKGRSAILAVHDEAFVAFLESVWARRAELPQIDDEILTGHFARPHMSRCPSGLLGLLGYHTADTSTPIRAGTWDAVYASAQVAICAADAAIAHGRAYALCRPPGHHAYADAAGGFCYLNNASIAAERMRKGLEGRVGILDIDVHHGNGTQGIFYERSDVLTVSIHADPATYFPFFAGYADETGAGQGLGFNVNVPLAHGSGDAVWLEAIGTGLQRMSERGVVGIVVSLGLDASEHDPLGVLKVTRDGFASAAASIAAFNVPTAIVQEGGYLCEALPHNLIAFLDSFDRSAPAGS